MKRAITFLLAVVTIFSLTQCTDSSADKYCSNADTRAKVITELMNNDAYMQEVMVAMKTKHSGEMASTTHDMMKEDKAMRTKMMSNMMDMCMTDTTMCKMMMGKTMEMCEMDKAKCSMMMGAMKDTPKGTQAMKDMGMCNMKGMDMSKKK